MSGKRQAPWDFFQAAKPGNPLRKPRYIVAYLGYAPLFFAGPILSFNAFVSQSRGATKLRSAYESFDDSAGVFLMSWKCVVSDIVGCMLGDMRLWPALSPMGFLRSPRIHRSVLGSVRLDSKQKTYAGRQALSWDLAVIAYNGVNAQTDAYASVRLRMYISCTFRLQDHPERERERETERERERERERDREREREGESESESESEWPAHGLARQTDLQGMRKKKNKKNDQSKKRETARCVCVCVS